MLFVALHSQRTAAVADRHMESHDRHHWAFRKGSNLVVYTARFAVLAAPGDIVKAAVALPNGCTNVTQWHDMKAVVRGWKTQQIQSAIQECGESAVPQNGNAVLMDFATPIIAHASKKKTTGAVEGSFVIGMLSGGGLTVGWHLSAMHTFTVTDVDAYGWVQGVEATGAKLQAKPQASLNKQVLEYLEVWQRGMFGMRCSSWPPEIKVAEGACANIVSGFGKQQEMQAKLKEQQQTISDLRAQVEALKHPATRKRTRNKK